MGHPVWWQGKDKGDIPLIPLLFFCCCYPESATLRLRRLLIRENIGVIKRALIAIKPCGHLARSYWSFNPVLIASSNAPEGSPS